MKKILFSLAVIGLIGGLVGGATWAYISDSAKAEGISVASGDANLEIYGYNMNNAWSDSFNANLNWDNVYPGWSDSFDVRFRNISLAEIGMDVIPSLEREDGTINHPLRNVITLQFISGEEETEALTLQGWEDNETTLEHLAHNESGEIWTLKFEFPETGEDQNNLQDSGPFNFDLIFDGIQAQTPKILSFEEGTVTLAENQEEGSWYVDRKAPSEFISTMFDNDWRLKHSINDTDVPDNDFYQYQGRKYDTFGATAFSIELYIPNDWENRSDVRAGMWATANNGNLSYPIIEFTNNPEEENTNPKPRFRVWQSNTGWVDVGLPNDFSYNSWVTLTTTLNTSSDEVTYTIDNLSHTLDGQNATQFINVILQGHNPIPSGATYDIYWDNFSYIE